MNTPDVEQILRSAAAHASNAPSILGTRPWRWRLDDDVLRLYAVPPGGRFVVISCGITLHHACTAIAASGFEPRVQRPADPDDADLLAEVRVGPPRQVRQEDLNAYAGIGSFGVAARCDPAATVEVGHLRMLADAASLHGTRLHVLGSDSVRRAGAGGRTAVHEPDLLPAQGIRLGVILTSEDGPLSWLCAGETLSAVMLAAAGAGLVAEPVDDPAELPFTRDDFAELGCAQLAVRIGHRLQAS
ncbi:hypothetical protein [Allorhizocola rhizosphaerae]|uniref:hypothetical protein n=1 Tax=Allorhizocola rhizosphaerae TaxID=1872709 RepID=UPI0013C336B3|nr:hypothetical protein [Allorhizocola rhizosphaerae]